LTHQRLTPAVYHEITVAQASQKAAVLMRMRRRAISRFAYVMALVASGGACP
jgi:hypothetical protein